MAALPASQLEERLGYVFKDKALLEEALTHPSASSTRNYQRLELLGDAVLGLLVSELLYHLYPNEKEGGLAKRKAALVCGESLTSIASQWKLGNHLILSKTADHSGGRGLANNLEDACEAVIGAIYLDGGLLPVQTLITRDWKPLAETLTETPKDPKTSLQEWAQGKGLPLPEYTVLDHTGPAHAPQFTVQVSVEGVAPCSATENSKRHASASAAAFMLQKIETHHD